MAGHCAMVELILISYTTCAGK